LLLTVPAIALAETAEALARSIAERMDRAVVETPESVDEASCQFCAIKARPTVGAESSVRELATGVAVQVVDLHSACLVRADLSTLNALERSTPPLSTRLASIPHYRC
jgi:hypothetical protein